MIIKVICSDCKECQKLSPNELYLEVSDDQEWGVFFFTCLSCGEYVGMEVGKTIILILMSVSVRYGPMVHPLSPITDEEVEGFTISLEFVESFVEDELLN